MKEIRTNADKLKTLLFGKDLRITEGDVYSEVREGDFSLYLPIDNYIYEQEEARENVFDIRKFGARANDKSYDNARAINACIEECSKRGGTVLVKGGAFTSTTVHLKSNVTLFIEKNSCIVSNESGEGYEGALVLAENCENITFTGGGKLCGNGNFFGRKPLLEGNMLEPPEIIDIVQMRRDYRAQIRFAHPSKYGSVCIAKNCNNIKVDNFIFENSASWTFNIQKCNGVEIKNCVINNNRNVANADGFDVVQCNDVLIEHCFVSTADDGIVIKNAIWEQCDGEMHNVTIRDCEIISRTNAIKVGTETTFDIKNIDISDCKLLMTDVYPGSVSGISLEACDGTALENVNIKNIEMNRCTCPLFIRLGNRNRSAVIDFENAHAVENGKKAKKVRNNKNTFNHKSEIRNINVDSIKAKGVECPVIISGYKQGGVIKRVENVTLKNISLEYRNAKEIYDKRRFIPEYAKEYPESWRFRNLPAYALYARHVKNLELISFNCIPAKSTWKKDLIFEDVI